MNIVPTDGVESQEKAQKTNEELPAVNFDEDDIEEIRLVESKDEKEQE